MNEEQLLKLLQFPKSTYVLRTFPYNKIEPQLNPQQRKVVTENVVPRGIRLLAIINAKNTNIPKFEDDFVRFEEIHFYWIQLNNLKKSLEVYKIFAHIIPYPLVILFTDGEHSCWVLSTHRKQSQTHLLTMDEIFEIDETISLSQIENYLSFAKMDKLNLKAFYTSWIAQLLQVELQVKYGIQTNITLENNVLQKLTELDRQINGLVSQAKREKQMNKRIALQVEANKLKSAKQELIEKEK